MALTTWLLMFGGLTFVAVVIDGVRRMFVSHAALKIDIDESYCDLPVVTYSSELPNGGARVVTAERKLAVTVEITNIDLEPTGNLEAVNLQAETLVDEVPKVTQLTSTTPPLTESIEQHEVAEELETEHPDVGEVVFEDLALVELANPDLVELADPALAELVPQDLTVADPVVMDLPVEDEFEFTSDFATDCITDSAASAEITGEQSDINLDVTLGAAEIMTEVMTEGRAVIESRDESSDMDVGKEHFILDRTPISLSSEEIEALTNVSDEQNLIPDTPDVILASSDFDPTRPVHELVETNSMVQSDLFAEQDLTSLVTVKSSVGHDLLETSDDILFSDTGIEELYAKEVSVHDSDVLTECSEDQSLSKRFAKVTSMTFGKKLLSRKRVAEQEALDAVEEEGAHHGTDVEQVISIFVTANDRQGFYGPQLLQLVKACGMVFGEMEIFHRFEDGLRLGKTQFSMANMMEPGTFDLGDINHLHTPGVVFFLGLPMAQDSMQAFDYMLETAQCLASNLGGGVLDEQRSVMRPQTIAHCRQQIRDFERRHLTRRAQL
ncbi:cell division protein ZipA [Candidatus Njordibacter sp. Uisw_058]|uniref:cell division protein ZipA n=1 Tax=Candidatus Njordibacter sp. Uisw_058 TaxID=3230974 RepID=UPI003D4505B8